MTRVINLDSDTCAQDALGRRVIDLDFALAQVRADAEKIWVKDPRAKKGGYYRTVKGSSGKDKDKYTAKKYAQGVAKRGLKLAAGAAIAGGLVAGARKIAKQEIEKNKKNSEAKEASPSKTVDVKAKEVKPGSSTEKRTSKTEETQPDINAAKEAERIEWEGVEYKLAESGEQQPSPQSRLSNVKEGLDKTKSELEEMSKKAQEQIEKSKKFMEERKRKKQQGN